MESSLETERLLLYFAGVGKIEDHHFPGGRKMVEVDRFVLLFRVVCIFAEECSIPTANITLRRQKCLLFFLYHTR